LLNQAATSTSAERLAKKETRRTSSLYLDGGKNLHDASAVICVPSTMPPGRTAAPERWGCNHCRNFNRLPIDEAVLSCRRRHSSQVRQEKLTLARPNSQLCVRNITVHSVSCCSSSFKLFIIGRPGSLFPLHGCFDFDWFAPSFCFRRTTTKPQVNTLHKADESCRGIKQFNL
jgi:hypothetical protein